MYGVLLPLSPVLLLRMAAAFADIATTYCCRHHRYRSYVLPLPLPVSAAITYAAAAITGNAAAPVTSAIAGILLLQLLPCSFTKGICTTYYEGM